MTPRDSTCVPSSSRALAGLLGRAQQMFRFRFLFVAAVTLRQWYWVSIYGADVQFLKDMILSKIELVLNY